MAALGEERRFGLSCGRLNSGQRLSLYHVKLTDTALRALEAYQRLAASLPNQPVICFQGKQGATHFDQDSLTRGSSHSKLKSLNSRANR